ncbi:MAG TPA: hypothetical protein VGG19_00470 [Tepidisphaeraceae bacterium]
MLIGLADGLEPVATIAAATATKTTTAAAIATATTTAAAAVSATAATTTAATKSTAAATGAVFTGLGFVNGECTSHVLLAIKGCNSRLGFIIARHFDEPEALAAAGVPIADDLRALYGSMRAKQSLESRAIDVVAQIPHI